MDDDDEPVLVAAAQTGGVMHATLAYAKPGVADRWRGSCYCGWHTEAYAPAAMTWPALRAHVLDPTRGA